MKMSDDSDGSDIDSDVEAFLYSQIHHEDSEERPVRTEINNNKNLPGSSDRNGSLHKESMVVDVSYYRKAKQPSKSQSCSEKNCNAESDVITISSSDECEVVSDLKMSKYSYKSKIGGNLPFGNGVKSIPGLGLYNEINSCVKKLSKKRPAAQNSTKRSKNVNSHTTNCNEVATIEADSSTSDSDVLVLSASSANEAERPSKKQKCGTVTATKVVEKTITLPAENGDNWFVVAGDLRIGNKDRIRDFRKRKLYLICRNCRQRGHFAKECPEPMKAIHCYLCGIEGHHADFCNKLSCFICWKVGHSAEKCPDRKSIPFIKCSNCKVIGHNEKFCPDFWRKYHLTIKPGPIVISKVVLKPKEIVYCCNCGKRGHYMHECKGVRMERLMSCSRVDIVSYSGVLPKPQMPSIENQVLKKKPAKRKPFMRLTKKPKLNEFVTNGKLKQWKNKRKNFKGTKNAFEGNANQATHRQNSGAGSNQIKKPNWKKFRRGNRSAPNTWNGQENKFLPRPFFNKRKKMYNKNKTFTNAGTN